MVCYIVYAPDIYQVIMICKALNRKSLLAIQSQPMFRYWIFCVMRNQALEHFAFGEGDDWKMAPSPPGFEAYKVFHAK
jgi:hypothetical protein